MCGNEAARFSESQTQEVRAELTRLLESGTFRNSKRCKEFLDYIVEHTIHGPSGTLKERSIGVELFALPQDFDTGQHTIVRVTANEVRKKLAQRYLAENGSDHPVKISLPPGSYSAEFKWASPLPPATEAPPAPELVEALAPAPIEAPAAPQPRWFSGPVAACGVAALVVIGALLWWRTQAARPITVDAKSPSAPASLGSVSPLGGDLRMIAGSTNTFVDRSGRTWGPDRFFAGGNILVRPSEKIFRTLDPDLYRHLRSGDFRYDIPLAPGKYEL